MRIYIVFKRKETDNMALEFAKELLGDAYTCLLYTSRCV